tara:strand:+ start:894 stop:1181 length:288 start_codon:yes stop_codon:yes gene_type:complete
MAKRKTPKVKDLRPETVTDEQLKKIQTYVSSINRYQLEIGATEVRKSQLLNVVNGLHKNMEVMQKELHEEYGTTDIDINTGTLKYPENGETDKKD